LDEPSHHETHALDLSEVNGIGILLQLPCVVGHRQSLVAGNDSIELCRLLPLYVGLKLAHGMNTDLSCVSPGFVSGGSVKSISLLGSSE